MSGSDHLKGRDRALFALALLGLGWLGVVLLYMPSPLSGDPVLPDPPRVEGEGTLDLSGFIEARRVASYNRLAFREAFQGRPVSMNVDLVSVALDGPAVVVRMRAYRRHASPLLTAIAPVYPVTCTFRHMADSRPLSTWESHQELALSGRLGADPGTLEDCRLAAYVDARGRPAGLGSVAEVVGGKVRKLDAGQVFPPLSATGDSGHQTPGALGTPAR